MILRNASLKSYNTFGLDYKADYLITVKNEDEAVSLLRNHEIHEKPVFIIGSGSNVLFTKDFKGTIIHAGIAKIEIADLNEDSVLISAGSGIIWDELVSWSVNKKFYGFENLSEIPGTVGATPVQNIGAYGTEIKDFIQKVRCIDLANGFIREFNNAECRFGYRDSIFKRDLKGKYLVTRVDFRLGVKPVLNLSYGSIKTEAEKLGELSSGTVRQAVINIRKNKLPDPAIMGNAGSFFKNPVLDPEAADRLKRQYNTMPFFDEPSGKIKIPAGWLIEQCGWKGKMVGNAGVHEKQALVIVNYGKATGKEILDLSEKIRESVSDKFDIELEREVEVL